MTVSTTLAPTTRVTATPATVERCATDGVAWTDRAVADLAGRLAVDGPAAHAADLRSLAARACDLDVAPALLGVLTDTGAPDVARLRAFARVGPVVAAAA
jgi:hypothetical protein